VNIVHWSSKNRSGMHHVAESMAQAELALGVDSRLMDPHDPKQDQWDIALDADVHVLHTHVPDMIGKVPFKQACRKPYRMAFFHHGTPELIFENAVRDSESNGYGSAAGYSVSIALMKQADALMCSVPRHHALFSLMMGKQGTVDLIPMGMDLKYWSGGINRGKYQGNPSFLNCENQYPFKWGVEYLKMWPWIRAALPEAFFHISNIPVGTQRFVDVLAAEYGAIYGAVIGNWNYLHSDLRNIFKQVDFYLSSVRYGDFNRMSMEVGASGCKVIAYPGNPYADYWVREGDHRNVAADIIAIGKGDVEPRADKLPIPTAQEMGHATINVYERILNRGRTNWALGGVLPGALPENFREAIATAQGWGAAGAVEVTTTPLTEPTIPERAAHIEAELVKLSDAVVAEFVPVLADFEATPALDEQIAAEATV